MVTHEALPKQLKLQDEDPRLAMHPQQQLTVNQNALCSRLLVRARGCWLVYEYRQKPPERLPERSLDSGIRGLETVTRDDLEPGIRAVDAASSPLYPGAPSNQK